MRRASLPGTLALFCILALGVSCGGGSGPTAASSTPVTLIGMIKLTRMGQQTTIGQIWMEEAAISFHTKVTAEDLAAGRVLVAGSGTGTAGYDASASPCTNVGQWQTTYEVVGDLQTRPTCRLGVRIEARWTGGTATGVCPWGANTLSVPDRSFGLGADFLNNVREVHTQNSDAVNMITWSNKFEVIEFDTSGVSGCDFSTPIS